MIVKYDEGALKLKLNYSTDVGHDLAPKEDTTIFPGRNLVKTGVHIALPIDMEATIRPRSGCSLKGMPAVSGRRDADVLIGTIDPGYIGDVGIIIRSHERMPFVIPAGERIAQLVFSPIVRPDFDESPVITTCITGRGENGFNSTGTK